MHHLALTASRRPTRNVVEVNNTEITPADMMSMPEEQRIALLKLVSSGRMSMDEAMAQVGAADYAVISYGT